ncbi:MAG: hypothetical protein WDM96_07400 [Lacunisphaera sp.]
MTGPSAVIDARGDYSFAGNTLDFHAKFKPYDQPGSLLAAAVGLVMNPPDQHPRTPVDRPAGRPEVVGRWSRLPLRRSSDPPSQKPLKRRPRRSKRPG